VNDTKDPATPRGDIPVLFDIVERGKFAPTENMIKPPSDGDNINTDNESITIVPEPSPHPDTEVTKLSLDELEDNTEEITAENPIITAEMLGTESTEFTPGPSEAITDENPIIPKAMLELSETQNELVDQVMQKLMPHLEELALETLQKIVKETQDNETPDKVKDKDQ
jgi:hypothetical protein